MTPKEQYEARKVERKARRSGQYSASHVGDKDGEEILDCFDRFATALERIAEALEYKAPADVEQPPEPNQ